MQTETTDVAQDVEAQPLRDAMLDAIGALSDEERERLIAADAPEEAVRVWRELIADQAVRERQSELIEGVLDELDAREGARRDEVRRERVNPTRGLEGGAPPREPGSVSEWTAYIRDAQGESDAAQRRGRFAAWLAQHPDA